MACLGFELFLNSKISSRLNLYTPLRERARDSYYAYKVKKLIYKYLNENTCRNLLSDNGRFITRGEKVSADIKYLYFIMLK